MQLCGVPAAKLAAAWPLAEPYVHRGLAHDELAHLSAADVKAAIEARDMQLWLLDHGGVVGILVTEIIAYPRLKKARLVIAAADDGYRDKWLTLRPVIEAWAREQGCAAMEVYGRKGWERLIAGATTRVVLRWRL